MSENGQHVSPREGIVPDMSTLDLVYERLSTPIDPITVITDGDGALRAVGWHLARSGSARSGRIAVGVRRAITDYFDGDLHALDDLVAVTGGTPFQREVWAALRRIPIGETRTYGEIARAIGRPKAVRAVGLANRDNPVGIVVPCHRVIGKDASLTGYAGGLARKRWLLQHESAV